MISDLIIKEYSFKKTTLKTFLQSSSLIHCSIESGSGATCKHITLSFYLIWYELLCTGALSVVFQFSLPESNVTWASSYSEGIWKYINSVYYVNVEKVYIFFKRKSKLCISVQSVGKCFIFSYTINLILRCIPQRSLYQGSNAFPEAWFCIRRVQFDEIEVIW